MPVTRPRVPERGTGTDRNYRTEPAFNRIRFPANHSPGLGVFDVFAGFCWGAYPTEEGMAGKRLATTAITGFSGAYLDGVS